MGRGRKSIKRRYPGLRQFNKNYLPWNKDNKLDKHQSMHDAVPLKRVKTDEVPLSNVHDFGTVHKLRPEKEKDCNEIKDENIIVGLKNLQMLVDSVQLHDRKCKAKVTINVAHRRGLLAFCEVKCPRCEGSPHTTPMSRQVQIAKTGPPASELNERLVLSCTKTKMGPSDALFFLATLNITPPHDSVVYKKLNRMGDVIINVTEEVMHQNQQLIRSEQIQNGEKPEVIVEADGAYNNKLHAGFEAGTQCFSALMDNDRGLVLSCSIANKLCQRKQCTHNNCRKNYATEESISSAESKLIEKNLDKINQDNILEVSGITTDASAATEKLVRERNVETAKPLKHYLCVVHRMRCFQKGMRGVQLSSPLPPGADKNVYKNKLTCALRKRIYWEITIGAKRNRPCTDVHRAVANVLSCFSGHHESCNKDSVICRPNKICDRPPRYLPYNKYIDLNAEDHQTIATLIQKYFNESSLSHIRSRTTNKLENLHSMIFTYAPKLTLYARNFGSMCHSAIHTKTFGVGRSTMKIAKALNIKTPQNSAMSAFMQKRNGKSKYDAKRQQSSTYKRNRYLARKKKINRGVLRESLYRKCKQGREHNYGVNLTQ